MVMESKSILAVDDDPDLLEMIGMVLATEDYRVLTAMNGKEALEMITREMPSLILLDMRMPVMNGWEFAQAFRAQYDDAAPILVVTAAQDAKVSADQIGAEGYLAKPFDIEDLIDCVRRYARK